jgi:hypothetical protein
VEFRVIIAPKGIDYGLGLMDYGDGFVGDTGEALVWQTQVAHNATAGLTVAMDTNACAGAVVTAGAAPRPSEPAHPIPGCRVRSCP